MKSVLASSFVLLSFAIALPLLGCTADADPAPAPESTSSEKTPSEKEQRAQLYDDLEKAGAIEPQCNKGDFICCACNGGSCCAPN